MELLDQMVTLFLIVEESPCCFQPWPHHVTFPPTVPNTSQRSYASPHSSPNPSDPHSRVPLRPGLQGDKRQRAGGGLGICGYSVCSSKWEEGGMRLPEDLRVAFFILSPRLFCHTSDSCQSPFGGSLGTRDRVVELFWVGTFSGDRRGAWAPQGRRAEIGAPVPMAPNPL